MSNPESLIDLSPFNVSIVKRAADDEDRWSDDNYVLSGSNETASFKVDFTYSFRRYTGFTPIDTVTEENTLFVCNIRATEGYGLGSAATAAMVKHAKESGFHVARMAIINPRMIGVINKLQRLKIIEASYFKPEYGSYIQPQPPTASFMNEPNVVSANEASQLLQQSKTQTEQDDRELSAIDTVIFF